MAAAGDSQKFKIGTVLVSEGCITQSQLDKALSHQKRAKQHLPLGQLCVRLGFLSERELGQIVRRYKYKIRFGDLLLNMGIITPSQLSEVRERQKTRKKRIGELLSEMGLISEEQLTQALSIQLGVPRIVPDINLIDKDLALRAEESILRKVNAVPAFEKDGTVTLIMADPLSQKTINDFKILFRCQIDPAIASRSAIHNLLNELFQKAGPKKKGKKTDEAKGMIVGDIDHSKNRSDNAINIFNYIVSSAISEDASDIHIEPQSNTVRVRYRIDGMLVHKTDLPREVGPSLVSRIKVMCNLDISERRRHQDGRIEARISGKEIDLRVSIYASIYGENVVIRILHRQTEFIDLDKIGFSPFHLTRYKKVLDHPAGIVMVVGPTGSGKTTALYASLNRLNDFDKMIITVEDPVEYTIDGVVQGKLDPKLGLTYSDFLKSMMRQDADILMVGEIRDAVTAKASIQAALTGHKVLTSFHTEDTTGSLLRLMDMGIETFLISSTIVSVVAQRLIRALCPKCKEPYIPDKKICACFGINESDLVNFTFYKATGCAHCNNTGYKGRTAIHELLLMNDAIRQAILARKPSNELRQIARETAQLISIKEDGFYKAAMGVTALEEILRLVQHNEADDPCHRTPNEIVRILEQTDKDGEPDPLHDFSTEYVPTESLRTQDAAEGLS